MKSFFSLVLCAALLFLSSTAQAQTKRLYFAGYAGLSLNNDLDFSENITPSSGTYKPQNSFNFAGALGLRFNRNFRMEAELSYRGRDIESANVNGTGVTTVSGSVDTTALMINGYYDFDIKDWKTQPYITAGLGVGRHKGTMTDPGAFSQNFDDTAYNFMWNVGTGVKYRVRDNFAWTAGYRYLDGSDIGFGGTDLDMSSHELRIGLEWDLAYE